MPTRPLHAGQFKANSPLSRGSLPSSMSDSSSVSTNTRADRGESNITYICVYSTAHLCTLTVGLPCDLFEPLDFAYASKLSHFSAPTPLIDCNSKTLLWNSTSWMISSIGIICPDFLRRGGSVPFLHLQCTWPSLPPAVISRSQRQWFMSQGLHMH